MRKLDRATRKATALRTLGFGIAGLLLLFGALAPAEGQIVSSAFGYVRDESGASLPGVTVTAVEESTGVSVHTQTDDEGYYKLRPLSAGSYQLTAELDGMPTSSWDEVEVLAGQEIHLDFSMVAKAVSEQINVTAEQLVETSRSTATVNVTQLEVADLPTRGRDVTQIALIAPTVQRDPVHGFLTISGQRGVNTGLSVDGSTGKSSFYGYGNAGEATQNGGSIIAQDSVREFQVITSGFNPEYGASAGAYINVITRSGTNNLRGSAFYFLRDDSLVDDIPSDPVSNFRGIDASEEASEFQRENWGVSVGGPIQRDRTHFFFAYDHSQRDSPFVDNIATRGVYDAILFRAQDDPRFAALLEGYTPNADGIAAPDPINGRTASGLFLRSIDNVILFGKVDHGFSDGQQGSIRINHTDYESTSTLKDEESLKLEDTTSVVAALLSQIGSNAFNEARVQFSSDALDRNSQREGEPLEAEIRFQGREFSDITTIGKQSQLPLFTREKNWHLQNNFSYLFGHHDLKFGAEYRSDGMRLLFAGRADGIYQFDSMQGFLTNQAARAFIFFGNVDFPNYAETQEVAAVYAQDSWRATERLSLHYGLRYSTTQNPSGLEHVLPEGREIPDDEDNFAPRFGFAWSPTDRSVVRGGAGLFFGQTPALLYVGQYQENGLFPNLGIVGFNGPGANLIPLGTPIDNENPPPGQQPSPFYVDPDFEDPETWRANLGYERRVGQLWSFGVDAIYARGRKLHSNVDVNRTLTGRDEFGRPQYSDIRPDSSLGEVFTRQSIGRSDYRAITLSASRHLSKGFQFRGHYTWSRDKDTDSNERNALQVTVSDISDVGYDWGLSDRDIEHRLLLSGTASLPWKFKLSGVAEYRAGRPYTAIDPDLNPQNYPDSNGPNARAAVNGQVVRRNSLSNESVQRVDVRLTRQFDLKNTRLDLFAEIYNAFADYSFEVDGSQQEPTTDGVAPNPEFGIPDDLISLPRQYQLGLRVTFR